MTHVENLLTIIANGEALRDQMRREMEVMAELIKRQNETAKLQGAAVVKAEALKKHYKTRMDQRDKNSVKLKNRIKHLEQKMLEHKEYKAKIKQYILSVNNGTWPKELM